MTELSFQDFETAAKARGFDEVIVREWAPNLDTGEHTHPFSVDARVVRGSFDLVLADGTRHLEAGDGFQLEHGSPHAERYGPEGATFWVARRHAG